MSDKLDSAKICNNVHFIPDYTNMSEQEKRLRDYEYMLSIHKNNIKAYKTEGKALITVPVCRYDETFKLWKELDDEYNKN